MSTYLMEVKKFLKSKEFSDFANGTFTHTLVSGFAGTFLVADMVTSRFNIPYSNFRKIVKDIILTKPYW